MRVIGSQCISTSRPLVSRSRVVGCVVVAMMAAPVGQYAEGRYPVVSFDPACRHFGSLFAVLLVMARRVRMILPYPLIPPEERWAPGGSSMKGMNLSGKPGMVQAIQMPPTLGQPPMPRIQPRFGTLQFTTGPQQPTFTWHLGTL